MLAGTVLIGIVQRGKQVGTRLGSHCRVLSSEHSRALLLLADRTMGAEHGIGQYSHLKCEPLQLRATECCTVEHHPLIQSPAGQAIVLRLPLILPAHKGLCKLLVIVRLVHTEACYLRGLELFSILPPTEDQGEVVTHLGSGRKALEDSCSASRLAAALPALPRTVRLLPGELRALCACPQQIMSVTICL